MVNTSGVEPVVDRGQHAWLGQAAVGVKECFQDSVGASFEPVGGGCDRGGDCNGGIEVGEQDTAFHVAVQCGHDSSSIAMGVPPLLIGTDKAGDGVDVIAVGAFFQPGIVEFMESEEGFLPGTCLLGGGDFRQVQTQLVESFVLDCLGSAGGHTTNIALDMDQAALDPGLWPTGFDRGEGAFVAVGCDNHRGRDLVE